MTQFDHIYNKLVNDVLTKGTDITENVRTVYSDGTPAYYRSLIGYQFRYDNSTDTPPVLTTRYSPYKSAIREIYWMWILRSNDIDLLQSLGCKYWNEWGIKETDNRELVYIKSRLVEKSSTEKKPYVKIKDLEPNDGILYHSNNYGDFYLLKKEKNKRTIQFKDTGYITTVSQPTFFEKSIKDPYRRSVNNIGYYGNYKSPDILEYFGEYHKKWISTWENMVRRCSQSYDTWKKWYSECVLGEEFECCETFLRWVMKNNRYNKKDLSILQLDKDYYSSNGYSPYTCTLLTPQENTDLTLDSWYKFDNKYFFSKAELAKYLFKEKGLDVYRNNEDKLAYYKIEKILGGLRENNLIEIIDIKTPNNNNEFPRFKLKPMNTIKKAYSYQLNKKIYNFNNQLDYIIYELKHNPNSRRIITEMWIPKDLHEMALVPCLHLTQWSVLNGKLYLELRQRSADVALGVVSNLLQYSILHKLVAHECGLEPAEIIYTIHNAHIYDRHIPIIQEQINSTPVDCNPILKINYPKSIQDFKPEDVVIENYSIHDLPQYKYDIAI